jgi:lipoate-protein ligase A
MLFFLDNQSEHSPYINLATEEFCLRHITLQDDDLIVFMYVNTPSVVVGKHQNIAEEVNMEFTHQQNIPIVRRISGGGTVVHDMGNLNISYICKATSNRVNSYEYFLTPIIHALRKLGIPASINERNDIVVHDTKISGNAQFTSRGMMLSHGTLLINSDIDTLRESLRVSSEGISSHSRPSVRSSVANINDFSSGDLSIEAVVNSIRHELTNSQQGLSIQDLFLDSSQWTEIQTLAKDKYHTWQWNYGRSPKFTVERTTSTENGFLQATVTVKKFHIAQVNFHGTALSVQQINFLSHHLSGTRYIKEDILIGLNTSAIHFSPSLQQEILYVLGVNSKEHLVK